MPSGKSGSGWGKIEVIKAIFTNVLFVIGVVMPVGDKTEAVTLGKDESEKRKTVCLESLELERAVRKVDDITFAVGAALAGGTMAVAFRKR